MTRATTPLAKTILATGDMGSHITLYPVMAKWPLALFISVMKLINDS